MKNYIDVEWSLVYAEEDGFLLLVLAKYPGKSKRELGKTFTNRSLRNIEYEYSDSPNLILQVESSRGTRRVLVDDGNLVTKCCAPKVLRKDLILALRPYITRELMVAEAETPPKKSQKSKLERKKYKKRAKLDDTNLM